MELRSARRLRSQPSPGARRRFRPRRFPDGGGAGLINTLPDDMLLQVLARLCCARAAALTGALSRRWRGLWTHLTELSFRDISPDALDVALNQVACPALSRLKIKIPKRHTIHPARVSSLLGAAARLAPADLVFKVWGHTKDSNIAVEIPCFNRATSIKLDVVNLYLLPPVGCVQFPVLERLSISGCHINIGKLILHCPHLRVLEVCNCWGFSMIRIRSPTIENISVDHGPVRGIDIMAPLLNRLRMCVYMAPHFSLSFSAPMLKDLCLWCPCLIQNVGIGEVWRLRYMRLGIKKSAYVLYLSIDTPVCLLSFSIFSTISNLLYIIFI
jgi:hypothetical protein